jgi:hypothetical protein
LTALTREFAVATPANRMALALARNVDCDAAGGDDETRTVDTGLGRNIISVKGA